MKIEIISVTALNDGEEMMLTFKIGDDGGRQEKRKLIIFAEQYFEFGLRRGKLLDAEEFDKIEEASRRCKAIRKGSDLLSYSASSRVRLVQRLRSKGIDRDSATEAAEHLQKIGAIDERADVERLVRGDLKKLWGKKRIYSDLCAKGYDRDIVSAALDDLEGELLVENCKTLIVKRYKRVPEDQDEHKKMIAALVRYGYTYSEIRQALQKI